MRARTHLMKKYIPNPLLKCYQIVCKMLIQNYFNMCQDNRLYNAANGTQELPHLTKSMYERKREHYLRKSIFHIKEPTATILRNHNHS